MKFYSIYECNQNCACGLTCYNRVAQNGIQLRLQVFMTASKGWGLRCKDDIPKGSFVCTYAGQILTEDMANKEGMDFGDEYLAELDHLEVVEKHKEGMVFYIYHLNFHLHFLYFDRFNLDQLILIIEISNIKIIAIQNIISSAKVYYVYGDHRLAMGS